MEQPTTERTTAAPQALPQPANDVSIGLVRSDGSAMHPNTQSSPPPTSEFTRLLLLTFFSRYLPRAITKFFLPTNNALQQTAYALSMGIGSTFLSLKYGSMVKQDIKNIFSEAVAFEKNIADPRTITFSDIQDSGNKIVTSTVSNYRKRMFSRLASDALFFLSAPILAKDRMVPKLNVPMDPEAVTDGLVGIKGGLALLETWNRQPTMFEDLVTFITNKINPRNGLGQPINVGDVFDLFQHYADTFQPDKMFRNVLTRGSAETALWSKSRPIFQRIADLMNATYAYKHAANDNDYEPYANRANFALPKLIHMLGHDLIDPTRPERTLALIEVMNSSNAAAVKNAAQQIDSGIAPDAVLQSLGLRMPQSKPQIPQVKNASAVLPKGSTAQLDAVPDSVIDKAGAQQARAVAQNATATLVPSV